MEQFISVAFGLFLAYFSYPLLFIILASSAVIPIMPEEVAVIGAGFLAFAGIIKFVPAFFIALLGIIAADYIGYTIGRKKGKDFFIALSRRSAYFGRLLVLGERFFNRYDERAVFLARFFVGARFIVPILAGVFGMERVRFFRYAAFAALISVFFAMGLGYGIGYTYNFALLFSGDRIGVAIAVFITLLYLIWKFIQRKIVLRD